MLFGEEGLVDLLLYYYYFIIIHCNQLSSSHFSLRQKSGKQGMRSRMVNVSLTVHAEPWGKVSPSPRIFREWRVYFLPENKHT